MRRWILLFIAVSLHKSYAADDCQPKSEVMQLVKLCYSGDMGSVESNAKFQDAIYATNNGVNYCHNTLAFLSREGGRTKVEVVHENKIGQFRSSIYNFDSKAVYAAEKSVVVLKDIEARCFAIKQENDNCSEGFFGMGSSNIPVTLTLGVGGEGYKLDGFTNDRNLISQARGKAQVATGDFDQLKTAKRLIEDIRARLIARSKTLLNAPNANAKPETYLNYRSCMAGLNQWVVTSQAKDNVKLADVFSREDEALLGKVVDKYGWRGKSITGGEPASATYSK